MRKIVTLSTVIVIAIAVVLGGFFVYNRNEVTECTIEGDTVTINYVYESEKGSDNLVKITSESETKFKEFNWTEEDAIDQLDKYAESINGEGVDYKYNINGDLMVESLVIDLEKADLVYMSELNYISRPADDSDVVSLEETVKSVESLGASCKVKE